MNKAHSIDETQKIPYDPPRPFTERWQSGRMHRTRNPELPKGNRGFESHPLRHVKSPRKRVFYVPRGNERSEFLYGATP